MLDEFTLKQELRAAYPPSSRVRRGLQWGTVLDVGLLKGEPIVYVAWDLRHGEEKPTREAVIATTLHEVIP